MPTTPTLPAARKSRFPGTGFNDRPIQGHLAARGGDAGPPLGEIDYRRLDDALDDQLELDTHMEPISDTALLPANPTTANTIALYRIDYTAGALRVGGVYKRFAAGTDQKFLDASPDIPSYNLDGTTITALTADGKTYWFALVAILVSGAVVLRGVAGAEADDASEVQLTAQQIRDALGSASISGADLGAISVLARIKVQRVATNTITLTHTNPASDDALAAERGRGYALAATPS